MACAADALGLVKQFSCNHVLRLTCFCRQVRRVLDFPLDMLCSFMMLSCLYMLAWCKCNSLILEEAATAPSHVAADLAADRHHAAADTGNLSI